MKKNNGFIIRDGYKLSYQIYGSGKSVFVIGSSVYYPRIFSKTIRESLTFIFADHRGFASSCNQSKKDDFTISAIIEDIEAIRKELKLDKMLLIGHSIHAFMTLEYVKQYPKNVDGLILIASSPKPDFVAADRYFQESVSPVRQQKLTENLKYLDDNIFQNPDKAFILRMLAFAPMIWYDFNYDASKLWKDVYLNPLGAEIIWGPMFADYNIKKDLDKINCPVFLSLGRYDYWNPPYLWEEYRNYFKNLTIRVFEKSGHTPSLEESLLFDAELLKWLNNM